MSYVRRYSTTKNTGKETMFSSTSKPKPEGDTDLIACDTDSEAAKKSCHSRCVVMDLDIEKAFGTLCGLAED